MVGGRAAVFWPGRLQSALGVLGLAGTEVAAGGPPARLGEALFVAVSLGVVVVALIPRASQRDLETLGPELTVSLPMLARLRSALLRYPAGDVALNAAVGAVIGMGHRW